MQAKPLTLDEIRALRFYQKIDLPDGSTTNGRADHRRDPDLLGFGKPEVRGKRVLDVAANDGFWSFWAEKQEADRVLAIDVETYENYDWGRSGVPEELRGKTAKNANFFHLHQLFESKVVRDSVSVYDLDPEKHGRFDLSICYGLLYHLRHPLLAIDKLRGVTEGACVLKTHTVLAESDLPYSIFFLDDVFDSAVTNWTGATEACVVSWMLDAGFERVFVEKRTAANKTRALYAKTYVGCNSEPWTSKLESNPRFIEWNDAALALSRRKVETVLYPDRRVEELQTRLRELERRQSALEQRNKDLERSLARQLGSTLIEAKKSAQNLLSLPSALNGIATESKRRREKKS